MLQILDILKLKNNILGKTVYFSWNTVKETHNVNYIGMEGGSVARGPNNEQEKAEYFYSNCYVPTNNLDGGILPSGKYVNTQAGKPSSFLQETAGTYYYYSAYGDDCKKGLRANVTVVDNIANCPSTSTPCTMPEE